MTQVFEMKPGDRKYALKYLLSDYKAGSDLLQGATITFQMKDSQDTVVINNPGIVAPDVGSMLGVDGAVAYEWGVGETDTVGEYQGEFKIVFSDGLQAHYPSEGFIAISINPGVPG